MIFILRKTYLGQLLLLGGATLASIAFYYYSSITPRALLSPEMLIRGVLGGLFGVALSVFAHTFALLLFGQRHEKALHAFIAERTATSVSVQASGAITGSISEELLLRGYLFSYIHLFSAGFAFGANAVLSAMLCIKRRASSSLAAVYAVEATFYAFLFSNTHSLCMVVVAHSITEFGTLFLLTSVPPTWISYVLRFRKLCIPVRLLRQQ